MQALLIRPSQLHNEDLFKDSVAGLYPPLGLLYLASIFEEQGVPVGLCDELLNEDVRARIDTMKPGDLVGVSVTSPLVARTAEIVAYARERGCRTVIGGPHVSAMPRESLAATGAEAAVVGEGEETVRDFLREGSWRDVPGAIFVRDGQIHDNGPRAHIEELDALPLPARHLIRWEHYQRTCELGFVVEKGQGWTHIIGSRGCPYRCTFCASHTVHGRRVRMRSVEKIIEEIRITHDRWGVRNFTFSDDNFVQSEQRTQAFCRALLASGLSIRWSCLTRVGLSAPTLALMKRAGCVLITFGVESGSPEVLKRLKKQIDLDQVLATFRQARRLGIKTKSSFMVGLPGEGEAEFEESVRFAIQLRPSYLWLAIMLPFPGTEIHRQGMSREGESFLFSEDPVLSRRYSAFLRRYYLRPRYLMEIARNPTELRYYLSMFRAYLRFRREAR